MLPSFSGSLKPESSDASFHQSVVATGSDVSSAGASSHQSCYTALATPSKQSAEKPAIASLPLFIMFRRFLIFLNYY